MPEKNNKKEQNFVSLLNYGTKELIKGNYHKALALLSEAKKLNQSDHRVYLNLAVLHIKRNELDKALSILKEALTIIPHNDLYEQLANLYEKKGDYNNAIASIKKAISIKESPEYYSSMFNYAYNLQDYNLSVDALKNLIRLDPDNTSAYNNLGSISFEMNDLDSAINHFRKSLKMEDDPYIHEKLAYVYAKKGLNEKALESFTNSLESGHPYPEQIKHDLAIIKEHLSK